jgi:hypothetical protein
VYVAHEAGNGAITRALGGCMHVWACVEREKWGGEGAGRYRT